MLDDTSSSLAYIRRACWIPWWEKKGKHLLTHSNPWLISVMLLTFSAKVPCGNSEPNSYSQYCRRFEDAESPGWRRWGTEQRPYQSQQSTWSSPPVKHLKFGKFLNIVSRSLMDSLCCCWDETEQGPYQSEQSRWSSFVKHLNLVSFLTSSASPW
jgi:hypothetical protein